MTINKGVALSVYFSLLLSGISLGRAHYKEDTLYKEDKDFAPIL